MAIKKFPVLYHKGKGGKIYSWEVSVKDDTIYSVAGTLDGAKTTTSKRVEQKNIGKANETSLEEQAIKEAQAMWTNKVERKYSETVNGAQEELNLPMLAHEFEKKKKKLSYPVQVQPKLDGCFTYNAIVTTDKGNLRLGDIVSKKLNVKVLSLNFSKNEFEFKKIKHYFENGLAPQKDWCRIHLKNNIKIRCTWNHKILTQTGWKEAKELDNKIDQIATRSYDYRISGLILGTLLGDSCLSFDKRNKHLNPRIIFQHTNKELFNHKVDVFSLPGKISEVITGFGSKAYRFVASNENNFDVGDFYYISPKSKNWGKRKPITQQLLRNKLTREGLSLWIADDGSIRYNNGNSETPILSLSTHDKSVKEIQEIKRYFKSAWGVSPTSVKDKRVKSKPGYFLNFNSADTVYLLSRLQNVVWKGVEYKYFFKNYNYVTKCDLTTTYENFVISNIQKSLPIRKYDIEIEDNHNYLVNGIVVHNCRALAKWEGDEVILTSRNGKVWEFVPHINRQLEKVLPKDKMLDGELYIHEKTFQEITRLIKKHRPGETEQVQYWCYDSPSDKIWSDRFLDLYSIPFGDVNNVKFVPTTTCSNEAEIIKLHDEYVQEGFEGLIVRAGGPYLFGYRSDNLLKVKKFDDEEFEVVGHKQGRGRYENAVCWTCITEKGQEFDVNPKMTIAEKEEYLKKAESYYGQKLKVRFFGRSEDGIPRFSVGLGFRLEQDIS